LDLALAGAERLLAGSWLGLYSSSDRGQSWQALAPAIGSPNVEALLATGGELFLGARTGLYRWEQEQRRWLLQPANLPSGIVSLAVDPQNPQHLYTGLVEDGLYHSRDGGVSWQALPALSKGVPAIAIDPHQTANIFILAAWERVYESRDGGQNWDARWEGLGEVLETTSLAVDPLESIVYVGTELGLYRRHAGEPWRPVAPELAYQSILALLAQPDPNAPAGVTLIIGATRGIYRSLDRGETVEGNGRKWGSGLENISVTALLADPQDHQKLYAGTADNGVYASSDGGQSWRAIGPAELTTGSVKSLAWSPAGELFAITTGGVWSGRPE
jgi:photosystem II stability/assembly factor-like uncharacterized protein